MTVRHARVVVGTDPTELTGVDASMKVGEVGQSLLVQNESGSDVIYVGGDDVSTTNYGFKISSVTSQIFPANLAPGEKLYGVVASGTATVNVIYQGV